MLTESQKQDTLRFIQSLETNTFTLRDVFRSLSVESSHRRDFQRYLDELDSEEIIHRVRRGRYSLPSKEKLVSGWLSCNRDGYGFVAPDNRSIFKQDIFVPARNMAEAVHGDRVLIKVALKTRRKGRQVRTRRIIADDKRVEGTVVRVLVRKYPRVVGRFYDHPKFPTVVPLDARMFHDLQIHPKERRKAKHGQIVVASMTTPTAKHTNPFGRIVEVLGFPDDPGIEYEIACHKFGIEREFSDETLEEVSRVPDHLLDEELAGRQDFRNEIAVTIDGKTARDFDDAITLKKLAYGSFLLGVHIADVSHYVREGTALDQEAYKRGTSVYFPDRAIPMLPPKLSNGICSLKPGEDRLVFSVLMEVNQLGNVLKSRFTEGILRSKQRMTYTSVAKILSKRDPEEVGRYSELLSLFQAMEELCLVLYQKRYDRGAVDFDLPEAEIQFDEAGKIINVVAAERNIAHRIIEEFMLLANETVAERLSASGGPALYRIHQEPDPQKVDDFAELALALGYRLENKDGRYRPRDFQEFCKQLEGKPEGRFLTYLMLRSFMQACYSEQSLGHFGLAAPKYTHFTSPIRRYPDLVVHRLLKECLKTTPSREWQERKQGAMHEIAIHTSDRERTAAEAEREIEKIKKVQFMADKLGDEFSGVVFSVVREGLFIELLDYYIEGFVPATSLIDDNYIYRRKTHSLVGESNRKHFRLGSEVRVRLDSADRETNRLLFSVVH